MKNKYGKKVIGNVGISLFTSCLCLAFLVICFSGATLAIFNSRKEYKFTTLSIQVPDALLEIETLNEELEDENEELNEEENDEEPVLLNENEIDNNENEESNNYEILDIEPGSYKVFVKKVGESNGYCFLHIFDFDEENQKYLDEASENYIVDIKDAPLNGDNFLILKTTSKIKITIDNFTWNDSLKEADNFLELNSSILPYEQKLINHGGLIVTFNPGFETYELPEGYTQLTYVTSSVLEDAETMPKLKINDKDLELAEEVDDKFIPRVFIDIVDFEGLKLIPCMKLDNGSIGLYLNGEDSTYFEINSDPETSEYGATPINSTYMDLIDTGFENPLAIDEEIIDLNLPANQFTRFAYHFYDWTYNELPVEAVDFETIRNTAIENNDFNIEFVAMWEKNYILIHDGDISNVYYYDNELVNLLKLPEKEGSNFVGYVDAEGELIISSEDTTNLNNWINILNNHTSSELYPKFEDTKEE